MTYQDAEVAKALGLDETETMLYRHLSSDKKLQRVKSAVRKRWPFVRMTWFTTTIKLELMGCGRPLTDDPLFVAVYLFDSYDELSAWTEALMWLDKNKEA
jgi:hypothetical protein